MKMKIDQILHGLVLTSYAATAAEVTANYDDLTASPVASLEDAGIGTYQSITYNSFLLGSTADTIVGGVAAHTEPNNIVTNSEPQATNGTPSLTVAKPYTSFGLVDFWFGCDAHLGQGVASLATQCMVTVAAFGTSADQEVALAEFTFTPPAVSVTTVSMIHAVLPSTFLLPGIKNVTFIQNDPTLENLKMDTISYYLYK